MLNTDVSTCCPATTLEHGDIRRSRTRNASPCTDRGCKWPKSGRYVYVPVTISSTYSKSQKLGVDFTNLESFSPKSFTFLQKVNQCERNVQRLGYGAWRHGLLSWTLVFCSAATEQRRIIINALVSFHYSTCIRFVWRRRHVNYLHFFSGTG